MKLYQYVAYSTSAEVNNSTFRWGRGDIKSHQSVKSHTVVTNLRQSSLSMHNAAMLFLRELVAGLSPWSSGLDLRPAYVGFVVDKVVEIQDFFPEYFCFLSHS